MIKYEFLMTVFCVNFYRTDNDIEEDPVEDARNPLQKKMDAVSQFQFTQFIANSCEASTKASPCFFLYSRIF